MKRATHFRATLIVVGIVVFGMPYAEGYDQYSQNDDATNCRECHGDFRSGSYISPVDGQNWGNLHNIHRSTMLSGDCDVCHIGGDEFPVHLDRSNGGDNFPAVGCMGCHGVDPAPSVPNNNWWGAGLRAHHTNAGVPPDSNGDTCVTCHGNDPSPLPEDTMPVYYFTPDVNHPNKPTDPCLDENYAGAAFGLDNDGDLLHDGDDPDCAAATPTPTPTPTNTPTSTPTPTHTPVVPTPTPTSTPTQPPNLDLIFTDGFESGGTSAWDFVSGVFLAAVDYARELGGAPLMKGTVFLMVVGGAALAGLPRIRKRGRRRKDIHEDI